MTTARFQYGPESPGVGEPLPCRGVQSLVWDQDTFAVRFCDQSLIMRVEYSTLTLHMYTYI